ncbi:Cmx/CmrA family chloramphenicol efflux MFS transporter [Prescottella equi]|uniref:Cmx/CmrA family chloramphenicol efflux MFS transporter n=1 Tax=Rhodococcus hoagii TaxID=43767 RepID=A0A9Q2Z3J8_RHOHA|nr:Cmx/CmrA family chloramphenicol efflux MFS transporter [Prescottella equi]MBM4490062.1 Cmx/CmrA family chloramphenicol efflux MFS transporter [Prescottella equi]MBM4495186.1 Cmx/CmrA family chloramphenicol efflux MFS transporter [Prescottella equi]MBM4501135.1 Cmx/CmrA family chloramphenicol efflux MFS transporter [Prescottella equi]MBM4502886.1 Cmx/CmrA family chloramphenicol efflux MFS transporter [Prescottella equi]MBM4512107.1 Cmx/CmrA family chloramphenicol efflux MFS transporter [Pres
MPFSLYVLAVAVFAMGTSEFMLAGLVPDIAAGFDVSIGSAGLLTSAFAVGMIVGAPLMAALARRWPARATLLFFVLVFAVMHIVGAITTSFSVLLVARVIAALANAGFIAVALSTAATLVAADRKGRALAVLLSGTTIATVAGAPGGALLGTLLGYRATFWTIALLCLPAAIGIAKGFPADTEDSTQGTPAVMSLRSEIAQLAKPGLILVILLAALVNAATFATFTFLAPIVTGTAGLEELWVPVVLAVFGAGSFVGVTVAGRFSDQRPGVVIAVCGPVLLLGWIGLATQAPHSVALLVLAFTQGALSFAVGSTLIARVLYESKDAPTMGGSYATAALNIGAAAGPAISAATLSSRVGDLGPVWTSGLLVTVALAIGLPLLRVIAPGAGQVIR